MKRTPGESQPLRAEVVDWLMRLEAAPHDAGLRAQFEAWLAESDRRRAAYAAVEPVWRTSADLAPPPPVASVSTAGRDSESPPVAALAPPSTPVVALAEGRRASRRWRRRVIAAVGAVAAGLALVCFPMLQLRLQADHLTGIAEQRGVTLEDGSKVVLDADSAIAVRYGATGRAVELLSGQAWFEVMPNRQRPFVVTAAGVAVTVTGTAFSVDLSGSGVSVAVQSGSVDVALEQGAPAAANLQRGDRLRVRSDGRIEKGQIAADEIASWRDRQLVVYDAPVRDVVEQLGRYRSGAIVFRDSTIADRLVSGVIDLRHPTEALQALVELQQGSLIELTPYLTIISSR